MPGSAPKLTTRNLVLGLGSSRASLRPLFSDLSAKQLGEIQALPPVLHAGMGRRLHAACMCILLNPVKSQSTTGCGNLWIFASVHDASHAVIPDTITSIRAHEFESCSSLTSVTLSDSVTFIGARAFSGTGLTSARLPNSVTYIGPRAFMNCDSLTFASLPNALTQIAIALFYSCDSLTALNLPVSVTSILPLAFAECPSLTSVTIPSSAVNISGSAFAHNSCPTGAYIAGAELCNCTSCHVGNQSSSAISNLPSHSISPNTVAIIRKFHDEPVVNHDSIANSYNYILTICYSDGDIYAIEYDHAGSSPKTNECVERPDSGANKSRSNDVATNCKSHSKPSVRDAKRQL